MDNREAVHQAARGDAPAEDRVAVQADAPAGAHEGDSCPGAGYAPSA